MDDIPNEDWWKRVIAVATKAVAEAQPDLTYIATKVLLQHGANLFMRSEADRVAFVLNEIQSESFVLGVKKGIEILANALSPDKKPAPGTKTSEETKQ